MEHEPNGGFPEPLVGEPVRLVRCRHGGCGATTRVRLPRVLPAKVVRRVVCDQCRETFDPREPSAARIRAPHWLSDPQSRAWTYLSIPIAAAVVIGALILIQGAGG